MKLDDIGFYTLSDYRAENVNYNSPLKRCELLITSKCNFNCPYCRGTDKTADISYNQAKNIIDIWSKRNLKNIRFSGGEPTIVKWLVDLVKYTKSHGVERIAISTNGSADKKLYEKLLISGVNDFSVSLDACCSSVGDMMAGNIKGVYNKIIENIKFLALNTYVTVGIVLTEDNIADLEKIIFFASNELKVSDIRIITAAQYNKKIKNLNVSSEILNKHPILKYRINNIKLNRNVRGIKPMDNKKCPLLLDDMAVKGDYHYPCIIKMREGCKPIGKINNIYDVTNERKQYYIKSNCHNDKICKKNCLDVCIDYNNRVKELNKKLK
jgi:cyclic pyranopterin phosphate synthase